MVQLRTVVLLALDLASTALTLMTGLRENPVLVFLTGRYDHIRARMRQRRINYNIVRDDHINTTMLPDLVDVADSHRFYSAPKRTRDNLGEDRSTCMNVNSMSASVLALSYDDFFGKGARREQIFTYSISTPHCSIINLKPAWYDQCVNSQYGGNATACHTFIFDNFDDLQRHRGIQAGVPVDFGERGTPFLKCMGRPQQPFLYLTDLMVHQSFWAGGGYHIEVQSSACWAKPLLRDADWQWGLFKTESADDAADVVFAIKPISSIAYVVSVVYGIVSIFMVLRGIYVAFSLNNLVVYLPSKLRRTFLGSLQLPSMYLASRFSMVDTKKFNLVMCRGENLMASDLWMNHWLYMLLSIADSLVNMRTTYSVLEMGSWMLTKKRDFDNFIFVCSGITKTTWVICFVHTVFRFLLQLVLRILHAMPWLHHSRVISFAHWYIDSVAMFMSYKIYAVLLSVCLLVMYAVNETTTLMRHDVPYKQPVYGGFPNLTTFWGNEIICDFFVLCSIQLAAAHVLVTLVLLLTRFKRATHNRVLRLLQERFFFVGWDVMIVMEALGIDPLNEQLVTSNDVATTNCSLGALIQQLYASGPSGLVEFVGDSAFMSKLDGKQRNADDGFVRYPLEIARDMGLYKPIQMNSLSPIESWRQKKRKSVPHVADAIIPGEYKKPFLSSGFLRTEVHPLNEIQGPGIVRRLLHVHAEWRWGRILLVDYVAAPGELQANHEDTLLEFVVQDALVFLQKHDVHPLFTKARSLRIS